MSFARAQFGAPYYTVPHSLAQGVLETFVAQDRAPRSCSECGAPIRSEEYGGGILLVNAIPIVTSVPVTPQPWRCPACWKASA